MSNENKPNYEVKIPLKVDGNWEYFPICNPASETTKGTVLLSDLYDNSVSNLDTASSTAFTPKGANDLYKDGLVFLINISHNCTNDAITRIKVISFIYSI